MHELSIAQNIIEIVSENVGIEDQDKVKTIRIKVGAMSGVVTESLEFCFDAIKPDTPFKGARLEIERTPFIILCSDCNSESSNEIGIRYCGKCGSFSTEIISGTEMYIKDILV